MVTTLRVCECCGRPSDNHDGFQILRDTNVAASRTGETEPILCPACAAKWLGEGGYELAYLFCDQCLAAVESGQVQTRVRSETTMAGALPESRLVAMSLCPNCARNYDGVGRFLLVGMCVFVGGIALFGLVGWLLG